jgi:hypothetical protein
MTREFLGFAHTLATTLVLSMLSTPAAAQRSTTPEENWTPPQTAWGDPDLQGVWNSGNQSETPFERPDEFGVNLTTEQVEQILADRHAGVDTAEERAAREARWDQLGGRDTGAGPVHWYEILSPKNSRPWLVVEPPNGKVPAMTSEGQDRVRAQRASFARGVDELWPEWTFAELRPWLRCITRQGLPGMMIPTGYNNNYQIFQTSEHIVIVYEMIHDARIIPIVNGIDEHPHIPDNMRQWLGDSRAYWEDNTLVVDVKNFNGKAPYRGSGETLNLIERFTRTGPDTIEWKVTVDDDTTWSAPWAFAMDLAKEDHAIFEYGCHEGNHAIQNIINGYENRAEVDDAAHE